MPILTRALDDKKFYIGRDTLKSCIIETGPNDEGALIVFSSKTIAVKESMDSLMQIIGGANGGQV